MTITGQSALPQEEIDQMVQDAEAHAEEDRRRREVADARNEADSVLYQADKLLRDNGEQIPADQKAQLEEAQGKVREVLESDDADTLRNATQELMQVSQQVGQAIYAASGEAGQAAGGGPAGGAEGAGEAGGEDEDVVDAEVVDEGDEGDQRSA